MSYRFLLIVLASVWLAGCSAAGSPGQTTVIVVTATPPPAGLATTPADQYAPVTQPTQTLVPRITRQSLRRQPTHPLPPYLQTRPRSRCCPPPAR